jgi:hypothetical protein
MFKKFPWSKTCIYTKNQPNMLTQDDSNLPKFSQEEEINSADIVEKNGQEADANPDQDDTDPPLDEEDLEENNLSLEQADQIVWDPPKTGSAGSEEKDITA